MNLITTFVNNPVKVTVGVILLLMFGILSLFTMPMQLTPEVEVPTLTIETMWPGASPEEVEKQIIHEQEEQLKSVEGVRKMTSESMDSMGRITLEFPVGIDVSEALLKVNTKLAQVPSYPEDVDEPVINTSNAANRPIAWLILGERVPTVEEKDEFTAKHPDLKATLDKAYNSNNEGLTMHRLKDLAVTEPRIKAWLPPDRDVTTLRKFAEDYIESALERVEGVSNANVLGGREEELQVVVNPEHLAARGLTINDIRVALRGQNEDTSAGDYWEGKRRYVVRTLGQFRSPEQVENAIVARRDGVPVYVRDIAKVVEGYKKPDGIVKRFGTTSIAINVQRGVGENVLDVMKGVRGTMIDLNADILKNQNLQLVQVYDETEYIYSAMNLVSDNLFWGSIFTFLTLLVFLRNGWPTLIIFAHIIISTVGAFLVMAVLGRSLNVLALGGLAFAVGMLVDNAIVMLENIYRRHQKGESPEDAAVNGAGEVWGALLNATLANLAVFLPVLFIKEEAGQLFRDIAISISAAVALSMLVAVAVVPTAAMRILKPHKKDRHGNVILPEAEPQKERRTGFWGFVNWLMLPINFILKISDKIADWMVNLLIGFNRGLQISLFPRIIVVCAVIAGSCVLTWMLLPKVEYLPSGDRNLVFGIVIPPPGYNLDHLLKMGNLVEEELRPFWDVELDDPEVVNGKKLVINDFFFVARNRQVFIGARSLDPARAKDLVPVIQRIGDKLPGTFLIAKQASLFEQGLTGGRTVDIEITGPDINKLVAFGGEIFGRLKGSPEMPGLIPAAQIRPTPSLDLANPEMRIYPKFEQAADLRMTAQELGYAVDALVDGAYAADYYKGGDKIDLRIVGEDRYANSEQSLQTVPIATPAGQLVPLEAIANIRLEPGPEQVNHRTRQRAITLEVSPPPDMPLELAMDMITKDVIKPLQASGRLTGGYRISLEGTADKLRSTWFSLRSNLLLAVVITYLLMAATFESWVYPFVVIMTVPLGAVGGFAGLWLLNMWVLQPLDVLTMLGFIMLVGTVVNNPILIVEQSLIHFKEDGMSIGDAVIEAVRTRIRPIFMTTLGGLVGLLPLVLAPGAGSELYRGIGAVLLGGLIISTVVTLVFVPALLSVMIELQQLLFAKKSEENPRDENDRDNGMPLQHMTETVADQVRLPQSVASSR
ncbi:efflux RND transporter permease subunit [Anatilimnocola floriformis]|uniref:efflux RND transporter permease subunit n=1 Tax=Anatilimnocola floriformis TaxID=2948575 RepID=UPI0020C2E36E|nr:efflux RND transporter permease subunit [Anatilimnocola floriformis]